MLAACDPAQEAEPDAAQTGSVSFYNDVIPIFEEHCISCHEGENAQANLELGRDVAANQLLSEGRAAFCSEAGALLERQLVVPGSPEESALWRKISDTELTLECGREMPPNGTPLISVAPQAAETLRSWIAEGAQVAF